MRLLFHTALSVLLTPLAYSTTSEPATLNQQTDTVMFNKELLEKCSNAAGVSGFEDEDRKSVV